MGESIATPFRNSMLRLWPHLVGVTNTIITLATTKSIMSTFKLCARSVTAGALTNVARSVKGKGIEMGATKIEWTASPLPNGTMVPGFTWNPWLGCTKVGPPCDHCYAEDMMDTRYGRVKWGAGEDRVRTSASNWKQPFKWDRDAAAAGIVAKVFCLSLGDIWDNEVDPIWRRDAFGVMERTPHLLYLLLSKRIGNAIKMCDVMAGNSPLPRNAALGATMASQEEWDRDIGKLKEAGRILGARFTFASVEPMLGAIDTKGELPDWVIVGGESGSHARPMDIDWARSIIKQCRAAGVSCFMKQIGTKPILAENYLLPNVIASSYPIKDRKGGNWDEWPEDMRVREFPQCQ